MNHVGSRGLTQLHTEVVVKLKRRSNDGLEYADWKTRNLVETRLSQKILGMASVSREPHLLHIGQVLLVEGKNPHKLKALCNNIERFVERLGHYCQLVGTNLRRIHTLTMKRRG